MARAFFIIAGLVAGVTCTVWFSTRKEVLEKGSREGSSGAAIEIICIILLGLFAMWCGIKYVLR